MAEITAALVRDLRDTTGAGMMDCKKALVETDGNKEAAIDWLRKKGLAAAAKKSGRVAAEGLVGVALGEGKVAVVEINAETDFLSRNEIFQEFVETVAKLALEVGNDVEALKAAAYPGTGRTVAEETVNKIATIGENISVRRVSVITAPVVAAYVHGALKPGLGKIGVIVGLEGGDAQLGRQIGMHVAATRPDALDVADVDPAKLEREKAILIEKARETGKPDAIIEKMLQGQVQKYYADVVLLEQVWVHDGESRVKDVLKKAGGKLLAFTRFTLGEGIEKEESDFAAEVAKAAGV